MNCELLEKQANYEVLVLDSYFAEREGFLAEFSEEPPEAVTPQRFFPKVADSVRILRTRPPHSTKWMTLLNYSTALAKFPKLTKF